MEISFARSGGFTPATNVSGTIHFDSSGAHISAAGTSYRRDLPAEEAKQLQDLATAKLAQGPAEPANSPVRDGFQYDLSVKTGDGKTHKLTLPTETQGSSNAASNITSWVEHEAQKIWEHGLANIQK